MTCKPGGLNIAGVGAGPVQHELGKWLGGARIRLLGGLVLAAALASVIVQCGPGHEAILPEAQIIIIWVCMLGITLVIGSRFSALGRRRLWWLVGPALVLSGLGVALPELATILAGAGLGWIVVAQLMLRGPSQMKYQAAIQHLHRAEFDAAVAILDEVIHAEGDQPEHYQFRAELHRLAGNPEKAIADYYHLIDLRPNSAQGYAGLAEVFAQQGDYEAAYRWAHEAQEREPHEWLHAYTLGMIADRLGQAEQAVGYLEQALEVGVPHSRYRLLTRLWLARNHYRQGQIDVAREQVDRMQRFKDGLSDWQTIFLSEQAALLRGLLEPDVRLAQRLLEGTASLDALGSTSGD